MLTLPSTYFSFHNSIIKWLMVAILLAALLWLFLFDPQVVRTTPPCIFYLLTSLDCPGCGTARACHQLLHGHLFEAMDYNLLFVFVMPFLFVKAISYLSGRSFTSWEKVYNPKLILWLVLAFWVLRNINIPPLNYLNAGH
jgi:hypothetical protein